MDANWGALEFTPFDFGLEDPLPSDLFSTLTDDSRSSPSSASPGGEMEDSQLATCVRKRVRSNFPIDVQKALNRWILEHWQHPYMRLAEQELFMATWGMARSQLTTALNNRRQRVLGQNRARKCERVGWPGPLSLHVDMSP
jgi:hypothetical protein